MTLTTHLEAIEKIAKSFVRRHQITTLDAGDLVNDAWIATRNMTSLDDIRKGALKAMRETLRSWFNLESQHEAHIKETSGVVRKRTKLRPTAVVRSIRPEDEEALTCPSSTHLESEEDSPLFARS